MDTQSLVIILVALAAVLIVVLLLRGRRQRVQLTEQPVAEPERRTFAPTPKVVPPAAPLGPRPEPEVAAAKAGSPPPVPATTPVSFSPAAPGAAAPGDTLTMLKGLGPKAAAQLNALGITRFADLAALDEAGIAALDAQMGNFKGRIRRDQWVEQARLLAEGDRAGFEARFGKIG